MLNLLNSKFEKLELKKKEIQPKIEEINLERDEEIQAVNKKYDHMIYELNYEVQKFENDIYNEMIQAFVDISSRELDLKRSSALYSVSNELKEFKERIAKFEAFPKELVNKLHKVIHGDPIENVIYELDAIKEKYIKK